ncbi:fluoride efflux transporter CrcB [Zunongwangia sp. F363]|uniref:Fluoride-specific ion channel FluC n=1 Tax=Autumnicola tepida TaxID=3075595 RepID=A0ABU3CDN9_9FLAO|nr:fluoride efflux transporter CrcB [Zunongwangia sp. F363]MDT0644444.1 fluoride efflux transporter CrcB [Zunongwangia sp. F363]
MKSAILVFLGGGLGSILRYYISKLLNNSAVSQIPFGTFTVNILGSLFIGFLFGLSAKHQNFNPGISLFFAVGFCGGFTTFSTFALENQAYLRTGDYYNFFLYTLLSIVAGLLAVFFGLYLSRLT